MSALQIVVTDAGRAALVNAANNGTAPVTIVSVGVSPAAVTARPDATILPGEVGRITTIAGDVVAADTIHVTAQDSTDAVYTMRSIALYLNDGTLFGLYGQPGVILEKSAQAVVLLAVDVRFADIDAAQLTFGDTSFINPPATTERVGVVELATDAEAEGLIDALRALTPHGLSRVFTAAKILAELIKVDGAGSGLDADLLDGRDGSFYADIPARLGFTPANRAGDTFGGAILRDAGYGFDIVGGNPVFRTDALGASWWFDRAQGFHNFQVGAAVQASVDRDGYVNARIGMRAGGALVWTAGNDGAGSGADADMLDGREGSFYADIPGRLGYTPANRAGDTFGGAILRDAGYGFDLVGGNPVFRTDALGASWWFDRANGYHNFQVGNAVQGSIGPDGYVNARLGMRAAGAIVWHAANDGAGSGLDADLLDGRNSDSFASAGDFTRGSNARGSWERRPNGVLEQEGVCVSDVIQPGSWSIWSTPLPIAFPVAMEGATATLGNGGVGNGSAVTVMDVGTPFNGNSDTVLPAAQAAAISGFIQNNTGFATRMVIRWRCRGR